MLPTLRSSKDLLDWVAQHRPVQPHHEFITDLGSLLHIDPTQETPLVSLDLLAHTAPDSALPALLRSTFPASSCVALVAFKDDELSLIIRSPQGPASAWTGSFPHAPAHISDALSALTTGPSATIATLGAHRLLLKAQLTSRFFRTTRAELGTLAARWEGLTTDTAETRHTLAINYFCRLMFLYFIQAKGWLPSPTYVAHLLLHPDAHSLHTVLNELFFQQLNTPPELRRAPSRIPYLNGGLFQQAPVELANPTAHLPDGAIRQFVSRALEPYRFVENELHPEIAIDPAMLGHVFESLMAADQRASSGTFYTPPRLVDQLVQDAFAAALGDDFPSTLREDPEAALAQLDQLRILDPAVGSGAFLLGAAYHLVHLRLQCSPSSTPSAEFRFTLANNLCGVDVSTTALTICALRLWLALVSLSPHPEPLPNLRVTLRQGDALTAPHSLESLPRSSHCSEYRSLCEQYTLSHGSEKLRLEEQLTQAERTLHSDLLRQELARAEARVAAHRPNTELFEGHAHSRSFAREAQGLSAELRSVQRQLALLAQGDWSPAFDPRVHFAQTLQEGGFSMVLGNPPWVQLSALPTSARTRLKSAFSWLRAENTARGPTGDLSIAFLQLGASLLRPGGVLAFVLPTKVFSADYAQTARAELLRSCRPLRLIDLASPSSSLFSAEVSPAALIAKRGYLGPTGVSRRNGTHETTFQHSRGAWPLVSPSALQVLEKLLLSAPALRAGLAVRQGLKTGLNLAFVDPPECDERTPAIRGAHVGRFHVKPGGSVLFCHDRETGTVLETISETAATHLRPFREGLSRRSDGRGPQLHEIFRVFPESVGHRVVFRDISMSLEAAWVGPVVEGYPVALNSCYYVSVPSALEGRRLAAWLNSLPARFVAAAHADRALGGYRRFQVKNVGSIPLPSWVLLGDAEFDRVVDSAHSGADEGVRQLDALCCRRLGLSTSEVEAIWSEAEYLGLGG